MIYVPLEALTEAISWGAEVYAPHQDGTGELPPDLVAYLDSVSERKVSDPPGIAYVRSGVLAGSVKWGKTLYVPMDGAKEDPPQELIDFLIEHQPALVVTDQEVDQPETVTPDGSRRETDQPNLTAGRVQIQQQPDPNGVVRESGKAGFTEKDFEPQSVEEAM